LVNLTSLKYKTKNGDFSGKKEKEKNNEIYIKSIQYLYKE